MTHTKTIGELVLESQARNTAKASLELWGVSIDKNFMKSVANIIGTDLSKYKVVRHNQFVCSLMQVSRDERIPIGLWKADQNIIVSPAYKVFETKDESVVLPDYMNLWFKRSEFNREASYYGVGGVRGSLEWEDFCEMSIPVPSIEDQRRIVASYNAIERRISLKRQINDNLEAQAARILANFDYNASVSVRLDEIMTFENGFAFQSQSYLSDGRYRIVTIKNVKDGYIDLSDCAYIDELPPKLKESCILKIGDILLSLTGNVGRVGVVCDSNLLLNQRVAKVIAREQAYKPYLYYVLRKPQMKSAMESITRGTAQQNLSPIEALKLTIPFNPDLINSVSAILLRYYEYTIMNNMEIARLTALYNVALPKLMTVN